MRSGKLMRCHTRRSATSRWYINEDNPQYQDATGHFHETIETEIGLRDVEISVEEVSVYKPNSLKQPYEPPAKVPVLDRYHPCTHCGGTAATRVNLYPKNAQN